MTTDIFTISQDYTAEYEIKKSLFIGSITSCHNEREALDKLQQLASLHANANHLAFAWRIRQPDGFINERCHDAGEPSGTAGRPILAPLEGGNIINAVVGVVRYFGGVKLGTGGLARAYGTAAKMAIEPATLQPWVKMATFKMTVDYSQLQLLKYHLAKYQGKITNQEFTDQVLVTIELAEQYKPSITSLFTAY
ncbi:MAG: YigZ family protein [Gammaproteobacteria bacterium]|nr:YigZ family protein [Gammaproteobacteria bacterium]